MDEELRAVLAATGMTAEELTDLSGLVLGVVADLLEALANDLERLAAREVEHSGDQARAEGISAAADHVRRKAALAKGQTDG